MYKYFFLIFLLLGAELRGENSIPGRFRYMLDWQYWKTLEDNLALARLATSSSISEPVTFITSRQIRPSTEWKSGFKAYLGYQLPQDSWDLGISYTYIPSRATTGLVQTKQNQVIILKTNNINILIDSSSTFGLANALFNTLTAEWTSYLSNIDLDLAKTVKASDTFSFRPHIGYRMRWMKQNYEVAAERSDSLKPIITSDTLLVNLKEKNLSFGAEGGLWGTWHLRCGFSMVGHFGGGVTVTRWKTYQNLNEIRVINGEKIHILAARDVDIFKTLTPGLDLYIGIEYACKKGSFDFTGRIGWDGHVIYNQNHLITPASNLGFEGLTLSGSVIY